MMRLIEYFAIVIVIGHLNVGQSPKSAAGSQYYHRPIRQIID
jgi:hypothetical protein